MVLVEVVSDVMNIVKVVAEIKVELIQLVEQAPAQHLQVKMADSTLLVGP